MPSIYRKLTIVPMFLLFCSGALAQEQAADAPDPIEFPAWTRDFSGQIGNQQVVVSLSRIDDRLSGSYCYAPCSDDPLKRLTLSGSVKDGHAELAEHDMRKTAARTPATGSWDFILGEDDASGTWRAPDGKRSMPLRLRASQPFPYEVKVIASDLPGRDEACDRSPQVSNIRLYRQGRLTQELATESQGSCEVFVPTVVDANFDGMPDLSIALAMPAGTDLPYQTWLFDPVTRRFKDAPRSLQDIASPEFDAEHKTVVSRWRSGCCEQGLTTYRWQGGELVESAKAVGTRLPLLLKGKRHYCYVVPTYEKGHIEYPERVEQVGGRLVLNFDDFSDCEADDVLLPAPAIDVWQRGADGVLKVVRSERTHWKEVATSAGKRFCPEVPFFEDGKIRRVVLNEKPEQLCSVNKP